MCDSNYSVVSRHVKSLARDLGRTHRDPLPRSGADLASCEDRERVLSPEAILDALASKFVPDPMRSFEEARRFAHEDLAELDGRELWAERQRAGFLLAWLSDGAEREWVQERLSAVAAEEKRRVHHGR